MNNIEFLQSMNDIDVDLLLAADKKPAKKKKHQTLIRYMVVAACICILSGAGIVIANVLRPNQQINTVVSFAMNDRVYEIADVEDYVKYGLATEALVGRSAISVKHLTRSEVGAYMGTITVSDNGQTFECKVYHYAAFPDTDEICVIEYAQDDFQIYVTRR